VNPVLQYGGRLGAETQLGASISVVLVVYFLPQDSSNSVLPSIGSRRPVIAIDKTRNIYGTKFSALGRGGRDNSDVKHTMHKHGHDDMGMHDMVVHDVSTCRMGAQSMGVYTLTCMEWSCIKACRFCRGKKLT
jgi:hypothetical protein